MKKIYRHVKFYIKTSLKSIRRHIGMTLSAAMAVSITLILISMFMLIGDNLKTFTYHIEKQLTIRVSIDNVATQKEKDALMADIKKMDPMRIFYKTLDAEVYNGDYKVPIRLFFPTEEAMENGAASGKKPPVILFFHGGGWVTESVENYQRVCARMAQSTGQIVASVEYRLAPEYRFPGG